MCLILIRVSDIMILGIWLWLKVGATNIQQDQLEKEFFRFVRQKEKEISSKRVDNVIIVQQSLLKTKITRNVLLKFYYFFCFIESFYFARLLESKIKLASTLY